MKVATKTSHDPGMKGFFFNAGSASLTIEPVDRDSILRDTPKGIHISPEDRMRWVEVFGGKYKNGMPRPVQVIKRRLKDTHNYLGVPPSIHDIAYESDIFEEMLLSALDECVHSRDGEIFETNVQTYALVKNHESKKLYLVTVFNHGKREGVELTFALLRSVDISLKGVFISAH